MTNKEIIIRMKNKFILRALCDRYFTCDLLTHSPNKWINIFRTDSSRFVLLFSHL